MRGGHAGKSKLIYLVTPTPMAGMETAWSWDKPRESIFLASLRFRVISGAEWLIIAMRQGGRHCGSFSPSITC
jgi:hypothetical protein